MLEQQLLKLLCSHEFYTHNKTRLPLGILGDDLQSLGRTLVAAQEKYKRDISLQELKMLHFAINPALTTAQQGIISDLIGRISSLDDISPEIAVDVFHQAWRKEVGRELMSKGHDIFNGQNADLTVIQRYLDKVGEDFLPKESVDPITVDLVELFNEMDKIPRLKFNFKPLADVVPGLAGGELGVIFARPNAGKSLTAIHFTCAPGGFIDQGAKVAIIGNEEPMRRTMVRCVSSALGKTVHELKVNPSRYSEEFKSKMDGKLLLIDDVTMTVNGVEAFIKRNRPDIVILDQGDKIGIASRAEGTDKIRELYIRFREIAKIYGVAIIAVSQANFEAEGKPKLSYAMLENSRTGKGAEADLILGVGRYAVIDNDSDREDNRRFLTVAKNKITSLHPTLAYVIEPDLSRMKE
jgi:KaiC/GvpD/RAD55 family RecA-like ATPase